MRCLLACPLQRDWRQRLAERRAEAAMRMQERALAALNGAEGDTDMASGLVSCVGDTAGENVTLSWACLL
jgi:hypothetical protein